MNPIIKWPGGKMGELKYIKQRIPALSRYIEPFFGGGAVFFNTDFKSAIINDIDKDLINLYKLVSSGNINFVKELFLYVENWEKIPLFVSKFEDSLLDLYNLYYKNKLTTDSTEAKVYELVKKRENDFNGLFKAEFCIDEKKLLMQITKNIISKIKRIKIIELERGRLSREDMDKNIETSFRSGFYMHFRDLMNNKKAYRLKLEKDIANYYFVREFCYGSMFRYNANGGFNIPYGGIAYNRKDFRKKVEYLLSREVKSLFKKTTILNTDFENIFLKYKFNKNDFIFLDPPYDSDFSDYDNNSFGREDQKRLANCIFKTNANFLLVIKNTPFILDLYQNKKGIKIESFEKKYLYNVKGRNKRQVNHLMIHNYEIEQRDIEATIQLPRLMFT